MSLPPIASETADEVFRIAGEVGRYGSVFAAIWGSWRLVEFARERAIAYWVSDRAALIAEHAEERAEWARERMALVAEHAAERAKWWQERTELLDRIERLMRDR